MTWKIARKDFLLNVMTFKFAVAAVASILLVAAFASTLVEDYERRLEEYHEAVGNNAEELKKVMVYKNITPTIHRPPAVLSVFSEGMQDQVGGSARVVLGDVPEIYPASVQRNPFLSMFPVPDVSVVFKVVLSLLALLMVYDAIAGEKERGSLKLMLSGAVARHSVLLGKLLAGLLALAVSVTIAFAVAALVLELSPLVDLTGAQWLRMGLMYIASLLFVSAIFNFGLLVSCLTKGASTSLMLVLFFWVVFVFVVPNAGSYLATRLEPLETTEKLQGRIDSLQQELEDEQREFARKHPGGPEPTMVSESYGAFGQPYHALCNRVLFARATVVYPFLEPLRIKYADKFAEAQRAHLASRLKQRGLAESLSGVSPISLYDNMMSALARTDVDSLQDFVEDVRTYRREVIDYVRFRTADFSNPSYFTTCAQEDSVRYGQLYALKSQARGEAERKKAESIYREWRDREKREARPLDLRDFPQFRVAAEGIVESVGRVGGELGMLMLINVLFVAMSFVAFLRYDVR